MLLAALLLVPPAFHEYAASGFSPACGSRGDSESSLVSHGALDAKPDRPLRTVESAGFLPRDKHTGFFVYDALSGAGLHARPPASRADYRSGLGPLSWATPGVCASRCMDGRSGGSASPSEEPTSGRSCGMQRTPGIPEPLSSAFTARDGRRRRIKASPMTTALCACSRSPCRSNEGGAPQPFPEQGGGCSFVRRLTGKKHAPNPAVPLEYDRERVDAGGIFPYKKGKA